MILSAAKYFLISLLFLVRLINFGQQVISISCARLSVTFQTNGYAEWFIIFLRLCASVSDSVNVHLFKEVNSSGLNFWQKNAMCPTNHVGDILL